MVVASVGPIESNSLVCLWALVWEIVSILTDEKIVLILFQICVLKYVSGGK